jgi:hypothetical protein
MAERAERLDYAFIAEIKGTVFEGCEVMAVTVLKR